MCFPDTCAVSDVNIVYNYALTILPPKVLPFSNAQLLGDFARCQEPKRIDGFAITAM